MRHCDAKPRVFGVHVSSDPIEGAAGRGSARDGLLLRRRRSSEPERCLSDSMKKMGSNKLANLNTLVIVLGVLFGC